MPQIKSSVAQFQDMGKFYINTQQYWPRSVCPRFAWDDGLIPYPEILDPKNSKETKTNNEPIEIRIFIVPVMSQKENKSQYTNAGIRCVHNQNYGTKKVVISLIFKPKMFQRGEEPNSTKGLWYLVIGKRFNNSRIEWMYTNRFHIDEKKKNKNVNEKVSEIDDENEQDSLPKVFDNPEEIQYSINVIKSIWNDSIACAKLDSSTDGKIYSSQEYDQNYLQNNHQHHHHHQHNSHCPVNDYGECICSHDFNDENNILNTEITESYRYMDHNGSQENYVVHDKPRYFSMDTCQYSKLDTPLWTQNTPFKSRPSSPDIFSEYTHNPPDFVMDIECNDDFNSLDNNNNNLRKSGNTMNQVVDQPSTSYHSTTTSQPLVSNPTPHVHYQHNHQIQRPHNDISKCNSPPQRSFPNVPQFNERWQVLFSKNLSAINNNTNALNHLNNTLFNNSRLINNSGDCSIKSSTEDDMEIVNQLEELNQRVQNLLDRQK